MRKLAALILSLCAVYGVFLFGVGAAHAAKPAPFYLSAHVAIHTDNGKPSQWSTRLTPPEVKKAMSKSWVRNRINANEDKIKRESVKYNSPYVLSRNIWACDVAYVDGGRAEDLCVSSLDGLYDRYIDKMDADGEYVTYVHKGFSIRSDQNN